MVGRLTPTDLIEKTEVFTYWRIGYLVLFYGTFVPASGVGSQSVLFTGLPAPIAEVRFVGMDSNTHAPLRMGISNGGELIFSWEDMAEQTAGHTLQVSGAYVLF